MIFDFLWKKKLKTKPEDFSNSTKKFICGYDLDEWIYIGYGYIGVAADNDHQFFLFMKKDNPEIRECVIKGKYRKKIFSMKPGFETVFDLWASGESQFWEMPITVPSKYLQDYMLHNFNSVWAQDVRWWVAIREEVAQSYKTYLNKNKIKQEIDNVIQVDFSKHEKIYN